VGAVPLVINNQDASLFFHRLPQKISCAGIPAAVFHVNNPKKKSLRSHAIWALLDAPDEVLSDRALSPSPDCMSQ